MANLTKTVVGLVVAAAVAVACIPPEPPVPPPEEFPPPAQPSLRPADDAEVVASWSFADCKDGWTATTVTGTGWTCGTIVRGPAGDRTGEGYGWGVGMSSRPAGRTETMLLSTPITLDARGGQTFTLSVWHWLDGDSLPGLRDSGGGLLEVYDPDTKLWVATEPIGGYDGRVVAPRTGLDGKQGFTDRKVERVWRRSFFDLSRWAGQTIRVRFHAGLGTATPGDGWFLDDVQVFRGGVVEDVIDADLSTCGPGEVIRFPFRTCDEGFGTRGVNSSWACGPATAPAAYRKAPVGDGPQFDTDNSGLLFATAPSGLHYAFEASELVSPAMDLSGCRGRTTSLSFWHWYHFAPGSGGWVEVWDGKRWMDVAPLRGYAGAVSPLPVPFGTAHAGFVTPDDRGSGWRFDVFDVSPYVNAELRVRFRFFAGLQRRPGWYVDTLAVNTAALEGLPRLDGDPSLPGCGFDAPQYKAPPFDDQVPDPCLTGEVVVPMHSVGPLSPKPRWGRSAASWPPDDWGGGAVAVSSDAPANEEVRFRTPSAGSLCIALYNGDESEQHRVVSGDVKLDGTPIAGPERWNRRRTLLRERQSVAAGEHRLSFVVASVAAGAATGQVGDQTQFPTYSYEVLFRAGIQAPALLPSAGGMGQDTAAMGGESSRPRVSSLAVGATGSERVVKFQYDGAVAATVPGQQPSVLGFAVQIADPRSCRQVAEFVGTTWMPGGTADGWEDRMVFPALRWDGRDEHGQPVDAERLLVRVWTAQQLAGLDLTAPAAWEQPQAGAVKRAAGPPGAMEAPWVGLWARGLAWYPLFTDVDHWSRPPHVDFVANVGACGRDLAGSPEEVPPSCAPSAQWGDPSWYSFEADRRISVVGNFINVVPRVPGEVRSWWVRFKQAGGSWRYDLPRGAVPGWVVTATLPLVYDHSLAAPPPGPEPGSADVTVLYDSEIPGSPSATTEIGAAGFVFRGPWLSNVLAGYPLLAGRPVPVRGHLLATWEVLLSINRTRPDGTTEVLRAMSQPTNGEPFGGRLVTTHDDVQVDLWLPDVVEPGPAAVDVRFSLGYPVAGSPLAITVGPGCVEDSELDAWIRGDADECDYYSGTERDRTQTLGCAIGAVESTAGCLTGCMGPDSMEYDSFTPGACRCRDLDFGNPFVSGRFYVPGTAEFQDDGCDLATGELIEVVAPDACVADARGVEKRYTCPGGCVAGACRCHADPAPIIFGCLPFDWPRPPPGLEIEYRNAFAAECQEAVHRFVRAAGFGARRCYRAVPMWFPEHWSEHDGRDAYEIGSSAEPGNPSWPRGEVYSETGAAMYRYWKDAIQAAVRGRCGGSDGYLCAYADVNLFIALANWQWGRGDAMGVSGLTPFVDGVYSAVIARPESTSHELGHCLAWMDLAGRWQMLCEEGSLAGYDAEAAATHCDNWRPPSWGFGEGWREQDTTCWPGTTNCYGAPTSPGAGLDPWKHCFMGATAQQAKGGFCGYCLQHLSEALVKWRPWP